MRVLVTGAFGFVGTAVVERLSAAGHEIRALTSRPESADGRDSPRKQLDIVHGDIRDLDAMRRAVKNADAVCHLAALARVREASSQAQAYWEVNCLGTETLLKAAVQEAQGHDVPMRFVFASTGSVYGQPAQQPIPEDLPAFEPINDYGASKLAAERIVLAGENGVPEDDERLGAVALRLFNVVGAVGGKTGAPETIIPKTLAVARGERPALEINGDGATVRDFVHVKDVARAFELAMDYASPDRRAVFNVGATEARVLDVVRTVEEVTGRPVPVVHRPAGRGEAKRLVADTSRIRSELGWRPERSGLRTIVADAWAVSAGDDRG